MTSASPKLLTFGRPAPPQGGEGRALGSVLELIADRFRTDEVIRYEAAPLYESGEPVGFEVRGVAEALTNQAPPNPYMSNEVIRIHPRRIISWGMGPDGRQAAKRNVGQSDGKSPEHPAADGQR